MGKFSASAGACNILVLHYHMLARLFLGGERVHGIYIFYRPVAAD